MAEKKQKSVVTNPLASLSELTRQTVKESTPIVSKAKDGWPRFCDYANQYNSVESKSRGVTVWIDEEVKAALDKIKSSGACNVPVRHLVSAAVRTFIEEHKEDIVKAMQGHSSSLL